MAEWTQKRLARLEHALSQAAAAAAQARDGSLLRRVGEALERSAAIRTRLEALDAELGALEDDVEALAEEPGEDALAPASEPVSLPATEDRKYSVAARKKIVAAIEAAGVSMSRVSEAVYRAPSGSRVAMPFSAELEPGVWWLGAYAGNFDEVILLCETGNDVVCFHLPRDLVRDRIDALSRDRKNNVKFHVERDGGRYRIRLGHGESREVFPFDAVSDAHEIGKGR